MGASDKTIASEGRLRSAVGWIATLAILATYFALMLAGAFMPEVLAEPLTHGRHISLGIVLGLATIVFCVVLAVVFTVWRNRRGDAP